MRKLGSFLLGFAAVLFAASVVQAAAREDGDKKFTIHGEVRFRGEWYSNLTDFTDTDKTNSPSVGSDDDFDVFPYRVRLAAKGDLGHDIWVYGEFQNAGVAGNRFSETEPLFGGSDVLIDGGSETTLYQGYVKLMDVGKSVLDLTFGRQELVYDRGLHYSSLDFYNGISHDGVVADWGWDEFAISGFWFRSMESNTIFSFQTPGSDADSENLGVHFTHWFGKDKDMDVAYYLFFQLQNDAGIAPGEDRGQIYTIGGRWGRMAKGKSGWSWNAEGSIQSGDFSCAISAAHGDCGATNTDQTLDISGMVLEGAIGYTWHKGKNDQKVWGGYTLASGDDDPLDQDEEAFTPLFTDFHGRLGYADLFTITNIQAWYVGYKVNAGDTHAFGATLYNFTKAEENDSNVSPLTGATISAAGTMDDGLANELDLFYNYNMTSNFSFDLAWSFVDPDDAIEETQMAAPPIGLGDPDAGEDMGWRLTAQARARF